MTEAPASPKEAMAAFTSALTEALPNPKLDVAPGAAPETSKVAPAPDPKAAAAAPAEEKIPRTSQEWKKFTAKRDADIAERDGRIAKAEAKSLELETKFKAGVSPPELDKLKADLEKISKERDEYDERLKMVAVTQHPRFKQEFETRLNAQIELAKKIVPEEQKEAVERILSMPEGQFRDARIEELMGELSQVQAARIGSILNSVTEINTARQDVITHSKEEYDKMTAAQKSQADSRTAQMEAALKDSLAKAPEHPLYKKSEDAEWNKDVDARLKQAEQLARASLSVGDSTRIVLDHLALPVVQKQLDSSKAEVEKLKAQIQDITQSNPGIVSRSREASTDDGGTRVQIRHGSSPMEAAASWVKSLPKFG
jgi:hypothetical protein